MKVLRRGSSGAQVRHWQQFLIGQGYALADDGDFGPGTEQATKAFQSKHRLEADGVVGNSTFGKAMGLGFNVCDDPEYDSDDGPNWPSRPSFPQLRPSERPKIFGTYRFEHAPTDSNREKIRILGGWESENIVKVELPQLARIGKTTTVRFHRLAASQLVALWAAWEKAGLIDRVRSWDGSFVARFIRGSRKTLSNHAYGSAFDINYRWNRLGTQPALKGQQGCLRELVPLAHEYGFYWGGHFAGKRSDGMHFEIARLKKC